MTNPQTLLDLPIEKLSQLLRQGNVTSADLVKEAFANIEKFNRSVNAAISLVDEEAALASAKEVDTKLKKSTSLLAGIPYVMKDAYVTKGVRTTAGSTVLDNFLPPYSATVHTRLNDAGAILIGKMNMDSWGHGASTENTDFGPTKNPWDLTRVAGGSGGGLATALATRMSSFAIGEDTGGSIRNPAAWTNTSALKVSYGRVSRYGAIAYASSFDTVGPAAKKVEDLACVLEVIAGRDDYDATSSTVKVPEYGKLLGKSVKGKKIAIPKEFFGEVLDGESKQAILKTAEVWQSLGVTTEEISLPMLEFGVPMYYILVTSETSSNLARYDGVRFGGGRERFTKETKRRILTGTHALSAGYYDEYYKKAQRGRSVLIEVYNDSLKSFDAILAPVNPTQPPKFGELLDDPVKNMMADLYTGLVNIIGLPSLAIPCGFASDGLPIGMQLIGKMFSEDVLLQLGNAYQKVTNWHGVKPQLIS